MAELWSRSGYSCPPVIHVEIADMDETSGAYVAAENDTFYKTSTSNQDADNRNYHGVLESKQICFWSIDTFALHQQASNQTR